MEKHSFLKLISLKKTSDPDWKKDFVLEVQEGQNEEFTIQIIEEKKN